MPEARVIEIARAKINLALHVLGRLSDGYHAIDSIVAFAELGDRLILSSSSASDGCIRYRGLYGQALHEIKGNLVLDAERELRKKLVAAIPVTFFELEKNLPIAAGIGGGSADAAAALRGLVRLHGLDCDDLQLREVAQKLGSDIPVCLLSETCRMRGTGEIIEPFREFGRHSAVLVNPGIELPTASVFARLGLERQSTAFSPIEVPLVLADCRNDLTDAAITLVPEVRMVLAALETRKGAKLVRMSGSGPTCFGLFDTEENAEEAAARIASEQPGWWCRATQIGN